jgi:uncharacterized protein
MAEGALIAVRTPPLLSVDVSELLRRPGASERVRIDPCLDGLRVPLAWVPDDEPLHTNVLLEALVDGIHVTGVVAGELALECRRCLREFAQPFALELNDVFLYPGEADDEGDVYRVEGEAIDLEPLIRDVVMLAMPLNPLCREDCKGLCTTCGADLNEVDCGHSQEPVDLRWAGLEQLRRSLEE